MTPLVAHTRAAVEVSGVTREVTGARFWRGSQCVDVFPQGRGSGRRRADADDDKPYICDSK